VGEKEKTTPAAMLKSRQEKVFEEAFTLFIKFIQYETIARSSEGSEHLER